MTITDPAHFEAVRTGLEVIAAVRTLFPESFEWVRRGERYWIDLLLGTDRVRYAGAASTRDLPRLYAASDLFVWPACREAYGLAILEDVVVDNVPLGFNQKRLSFFTNRFGKRP